MKKIILGSVALFFFAMFVISSQTSCSKDSVNNTSRTDTIHIPDTVPYCTPTIPGLWLGTDNVDGLPSYGNQLWSPSLRADGTMTIETQIPTGEEHFSLGNWTLTGDTIRGTYTCLYGNPVNVGAIQSFKGYWDRGAGTIVGTWVNDNHSAGTGTFTVHKVN